MSSLRRRLFRLCFRMVALCSPRRCERLLALVLLFCNVAANFLAVL
jgi:hypothetical protein